MTRNFRFLLSIAISVGSLIAADTLTTPESPTGLLCVAVAYVSLVMSLSLWRCPSDN